MSNNPTIVNLSNSILKRFGAPTHHNSIKEIDEIIKNHKKVVVLLFDGLGKYIVEENLDETSNIRKNSLLTIDATYPPTTVASTTGFLSGKYPIETGWLGWCLYFEKEDSIITAFQNVDRYSGKAYPGNERLIDIYCPYKNIAAQINDTNNKELAKIIFPRNIDKNGPKNLRQQRKYIKNYFLNKDEGFIYAYWCDPDSSMHDFGTNSKRIKTIIEKIDKHVGKLALENPDICFIVIADHGMSNHIHLDISNEPRILEMLEKPLSLEKRTTNFFIKSEYKDKFKDTFYKCFSSFKDDFEIYSKEEALKNHLFGEGTPHEQSLKFIGDFIVCAKGPFSLTMTTKEYDGEMLRAHHAGKTEREMKVNVSVLNR